MCTVPSNCFLLTQQSLPVSTQRPTTWNSLPKQVRDPDHTTSLFACLLKTFLFSLSTNIHSALEAVLFGVERCTIKLTFYLLTYLLSYHMQQLYVNVLLATLHCAHVCNEAAGQVYVCMSCYRGNNSKVSHQCVSACADSGEHTV